MTAALRTVPASIGRGHGRLHTAPTGTTPDRERDTVLDAAHAAWAAAVQHGRDALLLAADTATVLELNLRARTGRVLTGAVTAGGVELRDGSTAGVGDLIRARRNNRTLTDTHGRWMRNGDPLTVTAVHPDGSLTARRHHDIADEAPTLVRLPADYVAEHVELGYATTVHRAQGLTVDEAHLVLTPGNTRETLYVGMTRGRSANHAWVSTTPPGGDAEIHQHGPPTTPGQVLRQALATSGLERSATEQLADLSRRLTARRQPPTPSVTRTSAYAHTAMQPAHHSPTLHR